MPIKTVGETTPHRGIKTITATGGDQPNKTDLVDRTWIITLKAFDPEHIGTYGPTTRAIIDLHELGGANQQIPAFWMFSTAAKQIGEALQPEETTVATFTKATSKNGREYFAVTWITDPAVIAQAETIVAPF